MVGRASRRRGYETCGHDGRAQPRAVRAMPRPVERARASDGAHDGHERSINLSFPSVFVRATVTTSRTQITAPVPVARILELDGGTQ